MGRFAEVRAVFFDAVGTLIHPDPPAALVYAEVGRRFGSRVAPDAVPRRFAAAFAREEEADRAAGWRTDEARERRRWQAIVAAVLDDVKDAEGCFAELYEHFAQPEAWRVEPGAAGALAAVASGGFAVGMASNYDRRLRRVLAGLSELGALREVVVSSEVGWRKPAAEFFLAGAGRLGLAPGQVLFIGDDRANDYDGARAAGCAALLFDPRGREPAAERVAALAEVPGCLSGS